MRTLTFLVIALGCGSSGGGNDCTPEKEICDGLDNDCDGDIDETFDVGEACKTGLVGPCGETGTLACSQDGSSAVCQPTGPKPKQELCNDIDDDCDGEIDEDFSLGVACDNGELGICFLSGVLVCLNDAAICDAPKGTPDTELCNDLDDDCDGDTDEDFSLGASCDSLEDDDECEDDAFACEDDGTASCQDEGDAIVEVCDEMDNDCDDEIDEGCPGQVVARFPWNGYRTGSFWAERAPRFAWDAATDATLYEVELDDSCTFPDFVDCAFPSPEVSTSTDASPFLLLEDVPVSSEAPVGTRYVWRVRACNEMGCSNWSTPRYLDVDRIAGDVNGDGYADAIMGGPGHAIGDGSASLFLGTSTGLPVVPDLLLASPGIGGAFTPTHFGRASAAAGDLNGDDLCDVVIGAPREDDTFADEGAVYVYYATGTGIPTSPDLTLVSPNNEGGGLFGGALDSSGDLDGDGVSDLVVGAAMEDDSETDEGRVYVYYGAVTLGISDTPDVTLANPSGEGRCSGSETSCPASIVDLGNFGAAISTSGDLDADGLVDLAVGAPHQDGAEGDAGRVFIFGGSFTGVTMKPTFTLDNPEEEGGGLFGGGVRSGADFDGDGFADLLVGALRQDDVETDEGSVFVFSGSAAGPTSSVKLDGGGNTGSQFGRMAIGDLNGDGFSDAVLSASNFDEAELDEGKVFIHMGAAAGLLATATLSMDHPDNVVDGLLGLGLAINDFDGDGFGDAAIGAPNVVITDANNIPGCDDHVYVYAGSDTGITSEVPSLVIDSPSPCENFFGIMIGGALGTSIGSAGP